MQYTRIRRQEILSEWMHKAFVKALEECGVTIICDKAKPQVSRDAPNLFIDDIGRSPVPPNVVESTAAVADDDVKLLFGPKEAQ
jgi:hypothetical protein